MLGALARGRPDTVAYGLDDPRHARASLQHAADSKYCLDCGTPYEYAAAYVGHLGDWRCPACGLARAPLEVARARSSCAGSRAATFTLVTPAGSTRVRLALPGLYNVYNATAAAAIAGALGDAARARSPPGSSGSSPPSAASSGSRSATSGC